MYQIKKDFITQIDEAFQRAISNNDALEHLVGSTGNIKSNHDVFQAGLKAYSDLCGKVERYGNTVQALSVLFGKLLTLSPDVIKQLTPQFQKFLDNLVNVNQELFDNVDDGDCETNE